jgi:phosphotransferase system HPr-like phosphotransfer protein
MENKTIDEKIEEKKLTLDKIDTQYETSTKLFETLSKSYEELYRVNNAKVDAKAIAGIASLLSRLNDLLRTRNDIENEINALLELEEAQNQGATSEGVKGSKDAILQMVEGGRK